jgi:hypothetical protein
MNYVTVIAERRSRVTKTMWGMYNVTLTGDEHDQCDEIHADPLLMPVQEGAPLNRQPANPVPRQALWELHGPIRSV